MAPSDWDHHLESLERSSDPAFATAGQLFAAVYRDPGLRPPIDIAQQEDSIALAVRTQFPTQFAKEMFRPWINAGNAFREALSGNDAAKISDTYTAAFNRVYFLWTRLINFMAFLLMTSVNRLKADPVKQHGGKELAAAIKHFDAFYTGDDEIQKERDQLGLVENLLKLYRRLDAERILGPEFIFHPLLQPMGGFAGLFPPRFEALLALIHNLRNKVHHDELAQRTGAVLGSVYVFLQASVLDLVSILRPICAHYYLVFFTETDLTPGDPTVFGLAFSGLDPVHVEYRLSADDQADADRIQPGQLYLVKRGHEKKDSSPPRPPDPIDYLDLTPFLIYEQGRLTSLLAGQQQEGGEEHLLFVFRRYRQQRQELLYREFAARRDKVIESFERTFQDLRDEIQKFGWRLNRFKEGVAEDAAVTPQLVTERTWRISQDHLGAVMNPAWYDAAGGVVKDGSDGAQRAAFTESLFVPPGEAAQVAGFFASGKRGLVIEGGSGIGKSNLVCDFFLRERRAGRFCLFLAARNLRSTNFVAFLQERVAKRINPSWGLRHLDAFLGRQGQPLTVFVDAVNEYGGPEGPIEFLTALTACARDAEAFRHLRIVITCRSEVWDRYREHRGKDNPPLDPAVFFTRDAIRLKGFDDPKRREALYSAYHRFFDLRPEYARLSAPVQALIRRPFMMALVAETYSNRPGPAGAAERTPRVIPPDLDYFELFGRLTRRKLDDAQWLDPGRREVLPARLRLCLLTFARVLFRRLEAPEARNPDAGPVVTPLPQESGEFRDAVRFDGLLKAPDFDPFMKDGGDRQLSTFEAALQVGLVEKLFVEEVNESGEPNLGRVFRFFHDQYTQYWLAAVYKEDVLGFIKGRTLGAPDLARLAERIAELVHRSANAPVLAGAIDHWLHMNMTFPPASGGHLLLPLLNRLGESESGAVRHYVRSFLVSLIERGLVTPEVLYRYLFQDRNRALCVGMAEAFDVMEAGAGLPADVFRQFLDGCPEEYVETVRARLSDIFAHRFWVSPRETVRYLDQALDSVAGLSVKAALEHADSLLRRQGLFLLGFGYFAVVGSLDRPMALGRLRRFARRKYRFALDAVVRSRERSLLRRGVMGEMARRRLYAPIEEFCAGLWQRFGDEMPMSGNDRFFVDNDGVVQRDVLYEFFPSAVAAHNGDLAAVSLSPGSPFRQLIIRMLSFRVTSIIGYTAVLVLALLVRREWASVEAVIDDLIAINTQSCRYFGPLLLVNLSYSDPVLAQPCLRLLHDKMLPWILANNYELDWPVLHSLGVAANDVPALWPACERVVEEVCRHLDRGQDEPTNTRFGDELVKANFFPDPALGERMLVMMLTRGYLDHPLWRTCALKVMAGLLVRSPAGLERVLKDRGLDDSVVREARRFVTEPLILGRDVHIAQVTQNRFIARVFASNVKLRYLMIKILFGGMAQSNSPEDCAKAVRRFLVEFLATYFGDDHGGQKYRTLSVEEAFAEAESRRIEAGGPPPQNRTSR